MKKNLKRLSYTLIIISVIWVGLIIWVQFSNSAEGGIVGNNKEITALIVYNPDPIYNLDEQICLSFAKGLSKNGITSKLITTDNLVPDEKYELYVFCANTYNWAPDWGITNFISSVPDLSNKKCINITVGSGSTSRAKSLLDKDVKLKKAYILDSREFWLLKPNDENRMEESNVDVAVDMAFKWGLAIGLRMSSDN